MENSLSRFTVEVQQIDYIFQIPVRIFDTPSEMIKLFQLLRREFFTGKVGHKTFIGTIIKLDTNKGKSRYGRYLKGP